MKQTEFARVLTRYLSEYLPFHRNASPNTIKSYSIAFKQLLSHMNQAYTIPPERIEFSAITSLRIQGFLRGLETEYSVSVATRNQRLAAIKSFFRYASGEVPAILFEAQKILEIPAKKCSRPLIAHIDKDALAALLKQPDPSKAKGRRDLALMALLYDSAARVQELIDLRVRDVRLGESATVLLTGKGQKSRRVPIMGRTAALLEAYLKEQGLMNNPPRGEERLFSSANRSCFTRPGIAAILRRHLEAARISHPEIAFPSKIHPHLLRHKKALDMLEAKINLIYIRDFLGHTHVTTTEFYLRVDTELKRSVLEDAFPIAEPALVPEWAADHDLMKWLADLCK